MEISELGYDHIKKGAKSMPILCSRVLSQVSSALLIRNTLKIATNNKSRKHLFNLQLS